MKNFWKRTKNARETSLEIMKAALLVAVALVSGVVVCAIAYELIFFWGITILYLALQVAIGISIGSLVWSVAGKLATMFVDRVHPGQAAKIIRPFVWNELETE